jgi:hypothetical protein
MTIEDKILSALTKQNGISLSALTTQWVIPERTVIGHRDAVREALERLVDQAAVYKDNNFYYLGKGSK